MFAACPRPRRPILALTVIATLATFSGSARAASSSGVAVQADGGTWGTAPAANGRAQLATAVVETGGRAYIGGAFTKLPVIHC